MKSDREFLDGIYKKVEKYQKTESKELISKENTFYHKGYKTLRPVLVAGIAIAIISSGIYAYDLGILPFQVKNRDINMEGYNSTPELASHEMVRGVDPVVLVDDILPLEIEDAMKEGTVIRGRATVVLESEFEEEIIVDISKVYSGEEKAGTTIKVNFKNESVSTYSYNQLTGTEDILLYLKKDEDNQYSLAHETYGIFSFYEHIDGFDIFIGQDSVKLNTEIFTENVKRR
jgi:hypothetical protein